MNVDYAGLGGSSFGSFDHVPRLSWGHSTVHFGQGQQKGSILLEAKEIKPSDCMFHDCKRILLLWTSELTVNLQSLCKWVGFELNPWNTIISKVCRQVCQWRSATDLSLSSCLKLTSLNFSFLVCEAGIFIIIIYYVKCLPQFLV